MSPSEDPTNHQLLISVNPPPGVDPQDCLITVYDGWDELLYEGRGSASLDLPSGLYTVRWQYAGQLQESVIRLPQQTLYEITFERETPAPVPGAAHTHEYYSWLNQAVQTGDETGSPIFSGSGHLDSWFYLLIRSRDRETYHGEDLGAHVRLLDENLQPVIFELSNSSRLDANDGYLLCSLPAEPGYYFLEYRGEPPRLFPVHLFPGWQTRLFAYHLRGRPLLESASMALLRTGSQNVADFQHLSNNAAADAALNALQNHLDFIPAEIERSLLIGKFENPLLGLLGAHFLLRHPDASQKDPGQEAGWRNTAEMVFNNLDGLIPGSPDVTALRFKAALRFSGDNRFLPPPTPLRQVPMLRAGLEALLEADSELIDAIEDDSLLERLSPKLLLDSAWSSFRHAVTQAGGVLQGAGGIDFGDPVAGLPPPESERWLENSIKEALEYTRYTGRDPDWSRLAAGLGVSYRKMLKAVEQVRSK
jgi:hypothetical protein